MAEHAMQTESAECGLACLATVASLLGFPTNLRELRRKFQTSSRGASLRQLMGYATSLGMTSRAVQVELDELAQLKLPCILHWDLNHFVVLKSVSRRGRYVVIHDPATGMQRLRREEVSKRFTGVALELTGTAPIAQKSPSDSVLSMAFHAITETRGVAAAISKIISVALLLEVLVLVAPLLGQIVIDNVLLSGDVDLLNLVGLCFLVLALLQASFTYIRAWMVTALSLDLAGIFKSAAFSHLVRLPIPFFERRHLGDIASRFSSLSDVQRLMTSTFIELLLDVTLGGVALVMMLLYSWKLALVSVAALTAYGLLRLASIGFSLGISRGKIAASAQEQTYFLETVRSVTPIRLFDQETSRTASWRSKFQVAQNFEARAQNLANLFGSGRALVFGVESVAVLWLGAHQALGDANSGAAPILTVGMLFAFIGYKAQFMARLSSAIDRYADLRALPLHLERVSDIVHCAVEADDVPENSLDYLPPSIELRGVGYKHPGSSEWLFRGLDLSVLPGEHVAITGPSGGGKTTLLKIFLGLIEPTEGEVRFGGINIASLGLKNYRRMVGSVMQDDVLISGSIEENISAFESSIDAERVVRSARQAQVHADIARMPMAYRTFVGDMGSGLSGGQKQRIMLARALYRDPSLLILDEATSHLDAETESDFLSDLCDLKQTRLVVAHRASTIAAAQRVVRLVHGTLEPVLNQATDRGDIATLMRSPAGGVEEGLIAG